MKTSDFHHSVANGIKKMLHKGSVAASRLVEIARGALSVSQTDPKTVSKKRLEAFMEAFPETRIFFKKKETEAEEAERKEKIAMIRSKLSRTSS